MKNVVGESDVPILITEEGIQFAHSGVGLFVVPSELAVLKVNLLELTSIERRSESGDAAVVRVWPVFISSSVDSIKISVNKPHHPGRRFLIDKLLEEGILQIWARRSIDRGNFQGELGENQGDHC